MRGVPGGPVDRTVPGLVDGSFPVAPLGGAYLQSKPESGTGQGPRQPGTTRKNHLLGHACIQFGSEETEGKKDKTSLGIKSLWPF